MLLADSAQVADGKLYILGGGWSVTGPDPTPSAVAAIVAVDEHEFNTEHHWELFLEDADGRLVQFETPEGSQTIEIRGDFSTTSIAVNFGPIPLAPASRFTWRMVIDGESLPGATVSFSTRPLAALVDE
jgi:hypothetical protein